MIKTIAKVLGITVLSLVGIVLLAYSYCYFDIRARAERIYDVPAESVHVRYDSATIALGEKLSRLRACRECHGDNLAGTVLVDDAALGRFVTRNITKGKGGLPHDFSEKDWVLAIKHGLNREGKPLYLMPSNELSQISQSDLEALIAYCSQVPPVDTELPPFRIGPMGYVLSEFGLIPLLPAELTNHTIPFAKPVKAEISADYGKYLSIICVNCHGPGMKGGKSPVPGGKYIADISSTGNPGKWTHEQFIKALHTGETPEGKKLNPVEMPWSITRNFTEEELTALHLYLKSLP